MVVAVEQQALLELADQPGQRIGRRLTLLSSDGRRAVYLGPTPIFVFDADDSDAKAVCIATLSRAELASDTDIAKGFGVHRNTVGRVVRRFEREGIGGVVPAKRGPKGPSKVTPQVTAIIAQHAELPRKALRDLVERETGVSLSLPYVSELATKHRHEQLSLGDVELAPSEGTEAHDLAEAGDETHGASGDGATAGDDREVEDDDPDPVLPKNVSGRYMGLALYYPALAATGLLDVVRSLYRLERSARFGVRAVALSMFFMTVLGKTTVETAKHLRRAEFGAMTGTGRAPCTKTLRRKLAELVTQSKAAELGTRLARRWLDGGLVDAAYLYVDGHMKVYSGKRKLQEVWNSQRRMPLPGIHTYFVGDRSGRPLLFLSEELSTNLAKAMPRIVEAIRQVLGDRRFCVIFDRGGFDSELFRWLTAEGIDFITYQRGDPKLATDKFSRRQTRIDGRRVRFQVATDTVKVKGSGPWRRVVVRTKSGHQTPIVTNLADSVSPARIAALMFARWRQENFFKYMGAHRGIDDITSYAVEAAPADALIPNPARKALDRRIAEARKRLAAAKAALGDAVLGEPKVGGRSAHGLKVAQGGKVGELRRLEAEIDDLRAERKALPAKVPVSESGTGREVTRREAKAIVDRIKISAYNAEDWLLDRLVMHYRNGHDVRDLLRSFTELSGTIDTTASGVVVLLDPPDTPLHRQALQGLVGDLNSAGATFPGTDLPVTYVVRVHQSEQAA